MKVFPKARKLRVHVNIHNDKAGVPEVFTIHAAGQCIPAREVRIACPGQFVHDMRQHGIANPHIYFITQAQAYHLGDGVYELRAQ